MVGAWTFKKSDSYLMAVVWPVTLFVLFVELVVMGKWFDELSR
jgi:hypothetical protein